MAGSRTRPIYSNFSSGEWSPRLDGRIDLDGYASACKRLENFLLHQQGGATGRYGTHFVAEVKTSANATRLIPFRFSVEQAYIIEAGDQYFRFYKDRGRIEVAAVPVEIATSFTTGRLPEVHYAQNADTLFLTHPDVFPQELIRLSHTVWRLENIPFDPPPSVEYGARPNATVTPSAITGAGITLTASLASFEASDVGRVVEVTAGTSLGARATIVGYTSQTVVTADVIDDFADLNPVAAGSWRITESPKTTCVIHSAVYTTQFPVGAAVDLTLAVAGWRNPAGASDIGKFVRAFGGTVELTGFTSATVMTGIVRTLLDATPNVGGNLPTLPSDTWTLEESAWSAFNGYPRTVTWFDGRLLFGSTKQQPRTWWMSALGDPYNFALGSNPDDAMAWTVDTAEVNTIRWIVPDTRLLIGTAGSEHTAVGGNDSGITPANVPLVRPAGRRGSGSVQPLQTGEVALFLSASGKQLYALGYAFDVDKFRSSNTLIQAEHLTHEQLSYKITDLAFQQEPDGVVWAVRSDGVLLGMTLLRSQLGWARQTTDGAFEAVAAIPSTDGLYDEVWTIAKRTIGGATKRYVEWMDQSWDVYDGVAPGIHTDSCLTYDGTVAQTLTLTATGPIGASITATAGGGTPFAVPVVGKVIQEIGGGRATVTARTSDTEVTATVTRAFTTVNIAASGWRLAVTSVSGLGHLEGKTVKIVGDGAPYPDAVVAAGAVTLNGAAAGLIEVGLGFTPVLQPMRPEIPLAGTSQAAKKAWGPVAVRLHNTLGCDLNGEEIPWRSSADPMDAPPALFTGDKIVSNLGWDTDGFLEISQPQPLPITVLCLMGTLLVGD